MINNFSNDKYQQLILDLSNIVFIIDNHIVGDDIHSIILLLINNFLTIIQIGFINNIELSQYYAYNDKNCEIILRYEIIASNTSYGSIKFYTRSKTSNNEYMYTPIHIVYMRTNMHSSTNNYLNIDLISEVEQQKKTAMNRAQTDAIKAMTLAGNLEVLNPPDISKVVTSMSEIISQVKTTLTDNFDMSEFTTPIPTQQALNMAQIIADISIAITTKTNVAFVLHPPGNPIIISKNNLTYQIPIMADLSIVPLSYIEKKFHFLMKWSDNLYIYTESRDQLNLKKNILVQKMDNSISTKSFLKRLSKKIKTLNEQILSSDDEINLFSDE
jgi:hypothetical protein